MVKLVQGIEWAFLNDCAMRDIHPMTGAEFGNIPFCYSQTKTVLGYDTKELQSSFPKDGLEKLSHSCADLKPILDTPIKEQQWEDMFKHFKNYGIGTKDAFTKEVNQPMWRPHRELFKAWFSTIRKRSTMTQIVDKVIIDNNMELWKVFTLKGNDFPPKRKGTAAKGDVSPSLIYV